MTFNAPGDGSVSFREETSIDIRRLYLGDNLDLMREMASETVDLVYLDPPFNSNRNYKIVFRGPSGLLPKAHLPAFEDVWEWNSEADELSAELLNNSCGSSVARTISGLIKVVGRDRLMAYLVNITPRIFELRRLLRPTGNIYLHCDPTTSHYLKVIMDSIFGRPNFRNEIIWCYRGGGVPRRDFARKHDVILRYSKSDNYKFNHQYTEYSQASKTLVNSLGGVSIDDRERDLERGAHMPDWWSDINSLQTWSPERTGYPTQKPLNLLKRIINASSNEGDVVMDPFCGCGTAIHAAQLLQRSWIGIDIEPIALSVLRERFLRVGFDLDFELLGIPSRNPCDDASWKQLAIENPIKFERAAIGQIDDCIPWRDNQVADQGIDGVITFPVGRNQYRHAIVRVKGGRSLNTKMIRDLRETVEQEAQHGVVSGVLVSAHDPKPRVLEEANNAGQFEALGRMYPRLSIINLNQLFTRTQNNLSGLKLPATIPAGDTSLVVDP